MKLKKFFKQLAQFNEGVVNSNEKPLAVKYFMNPHTLDYIVVKVKIVDGKAYINFTDKAQIVFESEVIHYNIFNPQDRKRIINHISNTLESIS